MVALNTNEGIRAAFYVPGTQPAFPHSGSMPARSICSTPSGCTCSRQTVGSRRGPRPTSFSDIIQGKTVHRSNKVMSFLKSEDTGTEVFPLVNNFDGSRLDRYFGFLEDPDARALISPADSEFLASDKYRGLMVDFEDFPKKRSRDLSLC